NVNSRILAVVRSGTEAADEWNISPLFGDCKAYALTKRHELLMRGWPSQSLLLAEVVLRSGEHHLILVSRVNGAEFVLDNLNDDMRLAQATYDQYLWVRIQSPQNPKFWLRLKNRDGADAVASD